MSPPRSEDRLVAATTATQKDDHAGLSLDLGVSGPRRSHIGARIALPELVGMRDGSVAHAPTSRELDEDIWPQPKPLARAHRLPAT